MEWFRAAPVVFVLLWSGGYTAARVGMCYASPLAMLVLRFAFALVVLVPIVAIMRPPMPRRRRDLAHVAAVGLLIQFVYFGLSWIAISRMSVALVALILALQPMAVAILAPLLAAERVDARNWTGLLLGLAGTAMVILARSRIETVSVIGMLAAIGGLIGMVAGTLLEKRGPRTTHPLAASTIHYAVGLAATLPVALLLEPLRVTWSVPLAGALAYLVIGNSLISVMLLLAMIRRGAVSRVSALFFLIPPLAAVIAWIGLGDAMPPLAWGGLAVAAAGVALASRPARVQKGPEHPKLGGV